MPRDLRDYHARRDFRETPEPAGKGRTGQQRRFVVQKHAARRLHYDLRLEWDGVLLSWAVTRGPSTDPGARRLAVRTEDHPLDYADFEGTIPAGHYGAGTMLVWDSGSWAPVENVDQGLAQGKLKFVVSGQRMQGGWTLVRMKPRLGEKRENWLLIKERDAHAGGAPDALVEAHDTSVASGRTLEDIAAGRPGRKTPGRAAAKKNAPRPTRGKAPRLPSFRAPQLAMLASHAPRGDDWLHEIKFDGYRCIASVAAGKVRLYSRSGLDWSTQFGALVPDFTRLDCRSALIDGEVIAPGASDGAFAELQARLKHGGTLLFMAFDLLALNGRELANEPLVARKEKLEELIASSKLGSIRYSTHLRGHGEEIMARVCAAGQEGIVAKLASAKYRSGRHSSWRKIKCITRQEFVIGGWSPSGSRGRPFSSLLMGTVEDDGLRYRGRVGSGFGAREFETLVPRLAELASSTCPFATVPASMRYAHWLKPELVAEVKYAELTADGHIRHGVYQGLREDKPAQEIRLERAPKAGAGGATGGRKVKQAMVAGVRISSGERRVYESPPVTKLKVAQYYAELAERMLPFAGNRPLSLVRCPDGTEGECFFQKHRGEGMPEAIGSVRVRESKGGTKDYICLSDASGLVAAAQFGAIEFHIWGSRADLLERPDRLVFDLDPDEGLGFAAVRKAAMEMRTQLEELGLPSVPMLTGGKGVHVIVPLKRRADWGTVKLFARTFASVVAQHAPERYTATMAKSARKGRIFIDWLRNERGATAVAPYSLRARPGAKVAVPVSWQEFSSIRSAGAVDIKSVRKRLAKPCPLAEAGRRPVTLGKQAIRRLEKAWQKKRH
jgi:bifunctional non-homologous end joining protein LigD